MRITEFGESSAMKLNLHVADVPPPGGNATVTIQTLNTLPQKTQKTHTTESESKDYQTS